MTVIGLDGSQNIAISRNEKGDIDASVTPCEASLALT